MKWYYRGWAIFLAILCFGPLGLIPLWFRPRTRIWVKIFVSVVVCVLTFLMVRESITVYGKIVDYYELLGDLM